jgi:glycosyltransferase involved in cell wall biosynthesis
LSVVTAIITTHNRSKLLRDAIGSLNAEQYQTFDCVVVDDGGTVSLDEVSVLRPGTKLVSGKWNSVAKARNAGLAAATGEYVIYLDDDDVAYTNRIATLLAQAQENDADICHGLTLKRFMDRRAEPYTVPVGQRGTTDAFIEDFLISNPHINSVLARTEPLRAIGGFDEAAPHFDDWSAWLRMMHNYSRARFVDAIVAEWKVHTGGLTASSAHRHAMKHDILDLFRRLESLPDAARNFQGITEVVERAEIATYDDYVGVMLDWIAD